MKSSEWKNKKKKNEREKELARDVQGIRGRESVTLGCYSHMHTRIRSAVDVPVAKRTHTVFGSFG